MDSREIEPVGSRRSTQESVAPARPDCLLTVGSQCLTAILAEEGDSGLHVLIQGSPLFWVEDTGVLQTTDVEIAVRVSTIVCMEADPDDSAPSIPAFRIGLARLGQPAPIPGGRSRPKLLSLLPLAMSSWCPQIRISMGGLIAFSLLVTPLVFVAVAWRHHVHQADAVDLPNPVVAAMEAPAVTPTSTPQPAVPAIPEPTPEILRLPGVQPFLTREVAKRLKLSPSQTGAVGRLNTTTEEALGDLEKYWESADRLDLVRRRNVLLEAARQEALHLLTDKQRRQWEAMTR